MHQRPSSSLAPPISRQSHPCNKVAQCVHTADPCNKADVYRTIQRRAEAAGVATKIGCHSERARPHRLPGERRLAGARPTSGRARRRAHGQALRPARRPGLARRGGAHRAVAGRPRRADFGPAGNARCRCETAIRRAGHLHAQPGTCIGGPKASAAGLQGLPYSIVNGFACSRAIVRPELD